MDKQRQSPSADSELKDAPIPPRGFGQRELMAFDELFRPDMPDGKLINLYFLVEDWHTTDRRVFADAFKRVESTLLARMSGGLPDPNAGREFPIEDDDEIDKAEEAVKSGSLSHPDLLEMYTIASCSRNYIEENEELGRRWHEVLDLCRHQILKRISEHRPAVEPAKATFTEGEPEQAKQPELRIRDFELPQGYRIGDYEKGHMLLCSDAPTERMLDLLLYATEEGDGLYRYTPSESQWRTLRDDTGRALLLRMAGNTPPPDTDDWFSYTVDWGRKIRKAESSAAELSDAPLRMPSMMRPPQTVTVGR